MPTYDVLRTVFPRGGVNYPVFSGVAPAGELEAMCYVPSYLTGSSHQQLAENIVDELFPTPGTTGYRAPGAPGPGQLLPEPTTQWQRPENAMKVARLSAYYMTNMDHLMPNPIILAVRENYAPTSINTNSVGGSTAFFEMDITIPAGAPAPAQRPFLVIDGQHRLRGFAANPALANTPIPFVLLFDDAAVSAGTASAYTMSRLAGIFATVTTQATDLAEPHRNWMSFSFGLNPTRGSTNPFDPVIGQAARQAYEVALLLAARQSLVEPVSGAASTNVVFYDNVQMNPGNPVFGYLNGGANNYGIKFTIEELADWVGRVTQNATYNTERLAYAISGLIEGLRGIDADDAGDSKIFPDGGNNAFKIVREGVTNHLLWFMFEEFFVNPGAMPATSAGWQNWLTGYSFAGPWDFGWTSGSSVGASEDGFSWGGRSKAILQRVLRLRTETPPAAPLPCHTTDILTSLRGTARCIRAVFIADRGAVPRRASTGVVNINAATMGGWDVQVNYDLAAGRGATRPTTVTSIAAGGPPGITRPAGGARNVLLLLHGGTAATAHADSMRTTYNATIMGAVYSGGGAMAAGAELAGLFTPNNGIDTTLWPPGNHQITVNVCSLGNDTFQRYTLNITI